MLSPSQDERDSTQRFICPDRGGDLINTWPVTAPYPKPRWFGICFYFQCLVGKSRIPRESRRYPSRDRDPCGRKPLWSSIEPWQKTRWACAGESFQNLLLSHESAITRCFGLKIIFRNGEKKSPKPNFYPKSCPIRPRVAPESFFDS